MAGDRPVALCSKFTTFMRVLLILLTVLCVVSCGENGGYTNMRINTDNGYEEFRIPANFETASDPDSVISFSCTFPGFQAEDPTRPTDLYVQILAAGATILAERLAAEDPNRPGYSVPRLISTANGVRIFDYHLSKNTTETGRIELYPVDGGWLSVDYSGKEVRTAHFNRRLGRNLQVIYQVRKDLVSEPLKIDALVMQFVSAAKISKQSRGQR